MADRVTPGPVENAEIREAVCVHTRKVFDSCRDKDCVEDLRVYPTVTSQDLLDNAFSVRPRAAELLYAKVNVQEITFHRGYYTVDVTYFYRVSGETFPSGEAVCGLCVFDKRVMLFGSDASAKVFSSADSASSDVTGLPIGVVETVDPIALHMKIVDQDTPLPDIGEQRQIPQEILDQFDEELLIPEQSRNLFATLGQFSIIRLERETQLIIPAYDYCIPEKTCESSTEDDPCAMFSRIDFPVDEFFPPDTVRPETDYRSLR